jgi:predicted O-methyltransferase YrrM
MTTLQEICENAARAGNEIDLTGCDYGPHKQSSQYLGVPHYYRFLAGFVQTLGMRKILEIGTSYGGSMMAIARGCGADRRGAQLVTVDKVAIAGPGLAALEDVKRVVGDSLKPAALTEVAKHLTPPIDLLYIDSKHSYDHTIENVRIYGVRFRPRYVILDDIRLNAEMEKVWAEFSAQLGERAFDASRLSKRHTGFGVLEFE